ncbi:M13 family metallopeptidase [Microbacterium suaedae]|uniref:M13 family metallopeptidase n=1 Tax=Microbacterium suaedae TaxID=2067813 RepID=UPI000DA1D6C2|nr:M13-type metalloendopeptidase [Microbacterium suaedae]
MTLPSGLAIEEFSADIRPQDDLFRHVNGAWIDRTEIPGDKARWGAFHELAEQAEKDVRAIVEEAQGADGGEARKVGDLFTSFMDTGRIAERGLAPIQDQLAAVDAIADVPTLLRTISAFDREGITNIIGVYVEPDPGDPQRYIPFFAQAGISLPDEQYYRDEQFAEVRETFVGHVERMLALAGVADPADSAARIMALETAVAAHHWDNVRSRDAVATYNLMTWADVQKLAGVDLGPWAEGLLGGASADGVVDEVTVMQPSFLEGIGTLLTPQRLDDWKAWLRWKIVRSSAPYLTDDLVEENFAFVGTTLQGVPENRERWKRGISLVEGAMGEAVGKIYVDRHFPPEAKAEIDRLVANLIEAYRQSITGLEWMSPVTREKALDKLDRFTPKVGYPTKWIDYASLEIDPDDLLGNVRRASIFEHDRQLAKIGQPIDREEWLMTPQTVNAYYHPLMNEIVFPAAILQYPFFDPERDAAANYGGIGSVIGHEIGHGFDDQGSQYDGTGALDNWWTDDDRAAFEQRTKSLIDQYDALTPQGLDPQHTVNGALTIGENIGDLGGLGIALKAYALSLDGENPEEIDGFTGVQRVFLSWAQVWQQKGRDAETIRLLAIDPHSPNEFRCNQIVRNMDAFYDAFGVEENDELWLPEDQRVTIW